MDPVAVPRRLPNLLIVGVPKAGTGSLFFYLGQHPEICPASQKETGYFAALSEPGNGLEPLSSYEAYFRHCGVQRYAMEASPAYCYGGPRLVMGIRDALDRPWIVVILRDPVDRLWSAYTFQRSLMHLPGINSFEEYVAASEDQRRASLRENRNIPATGHFKGLAIGFYGEYLGDWFDTLGDQVRVVFFDDLVSDPRRVLVDLCDWLGIDGSVTSSFSLAVQNKTIDPRSLTVARAAFGAKRYLRRILEPVPRVREALRGVYLRLNAGASAESMQPATREHLLDLYRGSNRTVADQLRSRGYELPPWLADA
jgi:hypothetical protein